MNLLTIFRISLFLMTTLAGVMLAYAEGQQFSPELLSPIVILLGYFLAERQQRWRISNFWAGLLGLAAFAVAGGEMLIGSYFLENEESKLLGVVHLSVYLGWLAIFWEAKRWHLELRRYWLLAAFAVLQVALGALLTTDVLYGIGLILFLLLALWALSVFSLVQAQQRWSEAQMVQTASANFGFQPVSGRIIGNLTQTSQARGSVQRDPQERWVSLRFVAGYVITAVFALGISSVFFQLIPRFNLGGVSFRDKPEDPITGFTSNIQLGDMGQILESTEPALTITLYDQATGEPISLPEYANQLGYEEPMLRGAVLVNYANGRWDGQLPGGDNAPLPNAPFFPQGWVRQEIELQPIGTEVIFGIPTVQAGQVESEPRSIRYHLGTGKLELGQNPSRRSALRYSLYSRRQATQEPYVRTPPPERGRRRYLEVPESLTRLRELAAQTAWPEPRNAAPAAEPTEREKADRLVRYLRDSGAFSYSLKANIIDPTIDPIEDFLFNRKTGHCEYYASALALMLRAEGIPARLISGFRGAVPPTEGDSYVVQQCHAHAWVEAYVDDRWLVLDATPAAERAASLEQISHRDLWAEMQQAAKNFWQKNVVGLSLGDQRARIYEPLRRELLRIWEGLRKNRFRVAYIWTSVRDFLSQPENWFSWRGGLATFVLLALLAASYWLLKKLAKLVRWVRAEFKELIVSQKSQIDFYERFRVICAAHGLERSPAQTQQEFAREVHREINRILLPAGLDELPLALIESFYQVRFGETPLSEATVQRLQEQLTHLEQRWQSSPTAAG